MIEILSSDPTSSYWIGSDSIISDWLKFGSFQFGFYQFGFDQFGVPLSAAHALSLAPWLVFPIHGDCTEIERWRACVFACVPLLRQASKAPHASHSQVIYSLLWPKSCKWHVNGVQTTRGTACGLQYSFPDVTRVQIHSLWISLFSRVPRPHAIR